LPFDSWWGWGDFSNDEPLCRWEQFIWLAQIVDTVTDCITARVSCGQDSTHVLPSLDARGTQLRPGKERQWITLDPGMTGSNKITISCSAVDDFGQPVSNILIAFSFNTNVSSLDDGGHLNHAGTRPNGTLNPTSVRTDGGGNAQTTFTAPPFSGGSLVEVNANGTWVYAVQVTTVVPNLRQLFGGNNYMLIGSNTYHPSNHWVTSNASTDLPAIADDYASQVYPNGFPSGPGPFPGTSESSNDYYKLHYNDSSLELGGKFDIGTTANPRPRWNPNADHDEHRVGINCDVSDRNTSNDLVTVNGQQERRWDVLERIFRNRDSTGTSHEVARHHWHLRFYQGVQVTAAENLSPFNGTPSIIPGQIQAEEFDIGDYGDAFFVPAAQDPSEDASIENYDASDGSSALMSVSGQWTAYTVNVASSDTFTLTARVASPYTGSAFHVEVDGVNKTGSIYIPNTGSWDTYQAVGLDNISLDAGQHTMTVVIESGGGNVDYLSWSLYHYQSCQPTSGELNACHHNGGEWDYDLCYCVYY